MSKFIVKRDTEIEDLVREIPDSVTYLMEKGIRCLRCGEPIWGSIEKAAKEKGFSDEEIETFLKDLNQICRN
ncbi:MAG: DUF1858 domain-containing protein [Ignavibacteriales bacterium]|nr:DUF1858 domain-containing protein [Ignavibacteriales bacterium]